MNVNHTKTKDVIPNRFVFRKFVETKIGKARAAPTRDQLRVLVNPKLVTFKNISEMFGYICKNKTKLQGARDCRFCIHNIKSFGTFYAETGNQNASNVEICKDDTAGKTKHIYILDPKQLILHDNWTTGAKAEQVLDLDVATTANKTSVPRATNTLLSDASKPTSPSLMQSTRVNAGTQAPKLADLIASINLKKTEFKTYDNKRTPDKEIPKYALLATTISNLAKDCIQQLRGGREKPDVTLEMEQFMIINEIVYDMYRSFLMGKNFEIQARLAEDHNKPQLLQTARIAYRVILNPETLRGMISDINSKDSTDSVKTELAKAYQHIKEIQENARSQLSIIESLLSGLTHSPPVRRPSSRGDIVGGAGGPEVSSPFTSLPIPRTTSSTSSPTALETQFTQFVAAATKATATTTSIGDLTFERVFTAAEKTQDDFEDRKKYRTLTKASLVSFRSQSDVFNIICQGSFLLSGARGCNFCIHQLKWVETKTRGKHAGPARYIETEIRTGDGDLKNCTRDTDTKHVYIIGATPRPETTTEVGHPKYSLIKHASWDRGEMATPVDELSPKNEKQETQIRT